MLTITIEVDDAERESAILSLLLGGEAPAKPAPKATKAKKAEPEEDLLGTGPTLADAVAKATEMVTGGGAAKVKDALAAVGAKRVSEVGEDDVAAFMAALD